MSNGYPKRKRKRKKGRSDPYQLWIHSLYHAAVRQVIEEHPGLNVKQISALLPASREKILESLRGHRSLSKSTRTREIDLNRVPPAGIGESRITVRKHLNQMLASGEIKKVRRVFYARKSVESTGLIRALNELLVKGTPQDWTFPVAQNVAVYRTIVDPPKTRDRFDDFFDAQIPKFAKSLFCLDQIIEHAIGSNKLSPEFYDRQKDELDMKKLKKGWARYFGNTRLFVLAYAISPPKFLKFLRTDEGQSLAKRMLARNWESIVTEGRKERDENQRLKRQLRRIQTELSL